MKKDKSAGREVLALCALTALAAAVTGCVSNITSSGTSLGLTNLYFGTSGEVGRASDAGGVWSITLDPVTNYFSYDNITGLPPMAGTAPLNGTFSTTPNGFLALTLSQGAIGSGGYAVTLPKEGLLMRSGSSSTDAYQNSPSALIGATVSAACPAFTSPETFNFIAQGTTHLGDPLAHVAYGSVQITPGTSGGANSWSFSNFAMYDLSGNPLNPSPIPSATCPATSEGFVLVSPLTGTGPASGQITTGVSPSGLLVIDQGQSNFESTPTGPTGLLGVIRPSAALSVSDVVSKTYAGFESDPVGLLGTIAVVFGNTPGSGTAITGGGFPNDDVTKVSVTDTVLDLGAQSTQTPGLFPSVTLTWLDTFALCAGTPSGGKDSKGNPTCIFHGVAVAGQVGGKYVIFTNINDPTALLNGTTTPLAVINLALYQQ